MTPATVARIAAGVTAAAILIAAYAGVSHLVQRYDAAQDRASKAEKENGDLRTQLANRNAVGKVVTQYVDRVEFIKVKGDTIVKEVPRYVSPSADAACAVPVGFVRLHDAAAAGELLDSDPGASDAAASGLALSAVAGTVAENYAAGHVNAATLTALQDALRAQGVTIIDEDPAP